MTQMRNGPAVVRATGRAGTAEADAFHAGADEGHRRARQAMAEEVCQ